MDNYILTEEKMAEFERHLKQGEKGKATIEKYMRNLRFFAAWLGGRAVAKETVAEWKASLQEGKYAPSTINSKLASLNGFFRFADMEECRVKFLHIQRMAFREDSKELAREEYERLLDAAYIGGEERLGLAMETIGATGIRVSELEYITVEAVKEGRATVELKGKIRVILIPGKLCRKLQGYADEQGIDSGCIFRTRSGRSLSRRQLWREMKRLCKGAGVEDTKVFPHNLRHLFAMVFYKVSKDIVKLADVLGHSSLETTRIYLISTGKEHAHQMDRLGLVL